MRQKSSKFINTIRNARFRGPFWDIFGAFLDPFKSINAIRNARFRGPFWDVLDHFWIHLGVNAYRVHRFWELFLDPCKSINTIRNARFRRPFWDIFGAFLYPLKSINTIRNATFGAFLDPFLRSAGTGSVARGTARRQRLGCIASRPAHSRWGPHPHLLPVAFPSEGGQFHLCVCVCVCVCVGWGWGPHLYPGVISTKNAQAGTHTRTPKIATVYRK